jgi:3-oxoacyl-[acyl-carrier protein] reductase
MRLQGKRVVITGASRGIGRVLCTDVISEGGKVVAIGRNRKDLETTRILVERPGDVHICTADLRSLSDIEGVARFAREKFGAVDIIMNIAGVWHDNDRKFQGPLLPETSVEIIDDVFGVGLRGHMLLTRNLLPDLMSQHSGKVLFIACGFAGPHEAKGWLHYYVTNKAIEALTEGLAAEMRQYHVQVNCVAPWYVATEAVRRFYPNDSETALDPSEVSRMAIFLCSDAADNISGQTVELRSTKDVG